LEKEAKRKQAVNPLSFTPIGTSTLYKALGVGWCYICGNVDFAAEDTAALAFGHYEADSG